MPGVTILSLGRPETARLASPRLASPQPGTSSVLDAGVAVSSLIEAARGEARAAAQDAAVVAAACQFGAHLHLETSDVLVAETSVALGPLVSLGVTVRSCP